jgi:diguanylate cyclase (GGDEF)-like protein/PAS domain S-box-containing protein
MALRYRPHVLSIGDCMRTTYKTIGIFSLVGILIWITDVVLYVFFYFEGRFTRALFYNMTGYEVFSLAIVTILFFISGVFVSLLISKQERAEEEMKKSEEKYRLVVENVHDGITVLQDGVIKYANPRESEITGYERDSLMERPYGDLIHSDDREDVIRCFSGITDDNPSRAVFTFRMVDRHGSVKWIESNAVVVNWEGKTGVLQMNKDISERKRLEEELWRLSITDGTTGLYNQRFFYKKIQEEIDESMRMAYPLYLILFDLDNFKQFNDTFGHVRGDEVLREIGKLINASVRSNVDSAFRYGGDEFAILMPDRGQRGVSLLIDRLRTNIRERSSIEISIGVVEYMSGQTLYDFIGSADSAMYFEKKVQKKRDVREGVKAK